MHRIIESGQKHTLLSKHQLMMKDIKADRIYSSKNYKSSRLGV